MSLHASQLDRAWSKLGMDAQEKTNHRFALLRVNGKVIITTYRSRGSGEVPAQMKIRQQMKLDEDQFRELIACPLDRPRYLNILVDKHVLEREDMQVDADAK